MKSVSVSSFVCLLICSTLADASYIERRACAKTNIYRTLERLQRESNFCRALLRPNPTVSVPSSISATPIATLSSACNCIVATLTDNPTTTTTPTQPPTCPAQQTVTVTQTLPPSTVTQTLPPSTVTETATPSSTTTAEQVSHTLGFETSDDAWKGSTRCAYDSFDGFCGLDVHQNSNEAYSGEKYFRWSFYQGTKNNYVARFGYEKTLKATPNTLYDFQMRTRLWGSPTSCIIDIYLDQTASTGLGSSGTVQGGFAIVNYRDIAIPSGQWNLISRQFRTAGNGGIGTFFFVECACTRDNGCGSITIGFDDFVFRPAA